MPAPEYRVLNFSAENIESYIDRLAAAEAEIFTEAWSRAEYLRDIRENPLACYLGLIGAADELLAYGSFWLIGDEGDVNNIAVLPAYRRQGLGRALMLALQEACRQRGGRRMTLEVRVGNTAAIRLYEALGWRAAGQRPGYYLDNGEAALIMWLDAL